VANALERAKRDLAQLEDQVAVHMAAISRHQTDMEKATRAADEVRTFIRLFELYSEDDAGTIVEESAKSLAGFSNAERVARIAEEEIRRSGGHRVPTETIYQAAVKAGIPIGGKDDAAKRNQVSGILSRNIRFNGIRRRGWWLNALGPCPDNRPQNTEAADHDLPGDVESAASAEPRPTSEGTEVRSVNPWPGGGT
jgi:hypothetical protein